MKCPKCKGSIEDGFITSIGGGICSKVGWAKEKKHIIYPLGRGFEAFKERPIPANRCKKYRLVFFNY